MNDMEPITGRHRHNGHAMELANAVTPRDIAISREEAEELGHELEDALHEFHDDIHADPNAHEATVRLILYLLPPSPEKRGICKHSLEAIGRKVWALAILLRFCGESCADLARIYGGSRAAYSYALGQLATKLGLPHPDRSADAIESYRQSAKEQWEERRDAQSS